MSGSNGVSDLFAYTCDPFHPTGLLHSALIWEFVPSIIVTFCTMFSCYSWEACLFFFLREKEEE